MRNSSPGGTDNSRIDSRYTKLVLDMGYTVEFSLGHRDTVLNDHALIGDLRDRSAFSITGDIHIIYVELKDGSA